MLMKKIHSMKNGKMSLFMLIGASVAFLASCAGDGFTDESFQPGNGTANTKLTTPTVDQITVEVSTDGSKQTISWPVVYGAGGYKAVLTNLTTNKVLVDSIIDNLSFATSREEDTNYKLTLQVLGNAKLGNSDGDAVDKNFSSFTPSFAQIPAGADLYQYFQENPISDESTDELNYDLVAGATYTLSNQLGFNYHKVCLRSTDKANPATIEVGDNASFVASNSFSLKYLNIDVKAIAENARPVIELFAYESDPTVLEKPKNYFIIPAMNIVGCNFTNVIGSLIYDNNKGYAISGLTIKNTVIQMNTTTDRIRNEAFIAFQGGGVKDFNMENSTVYQTGEGNSRYFLRYNNSIRVDRITGSNTDFTTITYNNCTFYKVTSSENGQWSNYSGISNYSVYTINNNIWVDCSQNGDISRRIWGNGRLGTNAQARFLHNTYWNNGAATDQGNYDTSGTILTTDPAFEDAANADFTPTGAEQVQYQTGDRRWYE